MKTINYSCTSEWKARQDAYHCINADMDRPDDLAKHKIIEIKRHELAFDIVHHFRNLPDEFRYPSKSYVVAMVYARLLKEFFGGDIMENLNDPKLLFGSDPYFKTYDEDQECYKKVIDFVGWKFDTTVGTPAHIIPYFMEEFMITPEEKRGWLAVYYKQS